MLRMRFYLIVFLLIAVPGTGFGSGLLDPVREHIEALREELAGLETAPPSADTELRMVRLLLETGRADAAYARVPALRERPDPESRELAVRICLAVQDYDQARPLIESLLVDHPDRDGVRRLGYRWWRVVDDLGRVEGALQEREASGVLTPADRLAAGALAGAMLDHARSRDLYETALAGAISGADSAEALDGIGVALYQLRDFDGALARQVEALRRSDPDPDLLMSLSSTLIRLGRTEESIAAAKLAVEIAPYNERAHYLLGNGYADKNYTELFAAYPEAFADSAGRAALAAADAVLAAGDPEGAGEAYRELARAHPGWADVPVRLGSLAFSLAEFDEARRYFRSALAICPEYGRGHNGLAKALEGERLAIEVSRPAYEAAFAARPMPEVPGIEEFVINWHSLSPRHRKQVAISIEPWARYIPVLVESGSTYYIKPLHELLSETPGQELLRDLRISYDSRLWDDVRGCGGYHTVTGVEDVERTIQNRYNTVLHELTHQVHSVFPSARQRQIQELYRATKERDEEPGADAFLSRYAGGSVWEYLAEGANAYFSPRRDRFDTREIVRERLDEKDPALRSLVEDLLTYADVDSCYAVGYANRGDNRLESGKVEEAIAAYRRAVERSPDEESAIGSLIYALEVAGKAGEARDLAAAEQGRQPESATLALRHADAMWVSGGGLEAAIRVLEEARPGVREADRYQVDLARGRLYWVRGDADAAREAYRAVLDYQSDSPEGLWGLAGAEALDGSWDSAWTAYEDAVRLRTGVVDLRVDFARDLLRAGQRDRAAEQIREAKLLDATDPGVRALDAWLALEEGRGAEAERDAAAVLEEHPWHDFARLVLGRSQAANGDPGAAEATLAPIRERIAASDPPEYLFRPRWGRYEQIHTLPAVERELLPDGSTKP